MFFWMSIRHSKINWPLVKVDINVLHNSFSMTNLNILLFLGKTNNNIKFPQTLGWLNWLHNFVEHIKQSQQRKKNIVELNLATKLLLQWSRFLQLLITYHAKLWLNSLKLLSVKMKQLKRRRWALNLPPRDLLHATRWFIS